MKKNNHKKLRNKSILWIAITVIVAGILLIMNFPKAKMASREEPNSPESHYSASDLDRSQIESALKSFVPANSGVKSFEIVDLKIINNFAKVMIKPLDIETDNATVILKKDSHWKVIWGPGTDGFQGLQGLPPEFMP